MKSFINIVFFWIVFLSIESNAQIPQANNLISYYPFSGGIDDQSGKNHNTGTIYGNPSLTQNRFGVANAAYNLDGIDDYLYFGNSIYADLSQVNGYYQGSFTISIWAKSAVSDNENFISFGESDGYYTAMVSSIGNSISFNSANWGSGATISGKKSDNTWHQYTFVYSAGSFRKIFIDGVSVTQNNDSRLRFNFKNYGLSVGIGRFSSTGIPEGLATTYTGSVDDVRVWNVALLDSEVASLYAFDNNVANDFPAILVTNLADNGTSGTLRWAIEQANSNADASVINFDAALTGTITLTSNLPNITANLNITGSGKQKITISGNNLYKMFVANGGPTFSISSLTLTKGSSGSPTAGSIISASGSTVTANDILVTANTGNFLFSTAGDGSYLTITNSEFSTNSSYVLFGSDYGSTPTTTAADADYTNRITVIRSKFINNSNILFSTQRYVKIDDCEFTGNKGGIGNFGGVNRLQVLNSKFTSNGSTLFQYSSWLSQTTTNSWVQTLGDNNFLFNSNTFENNTGTVIAINNINNGLKTTITNNTFINNRTNWTGTPIAVSTNYLDNFISAVKQGINNSTIIVTMSKPVFGGLNSTGNVDINDFQFQLSGGNATLASAIPSSIAINGNTITLDIQLNGLTSGAELLKVVPIANSIYDATNNIAGTLQKNNSLYLKSAPTGIVLSANSINENSAIGTVLANLSSTDADANDTHTYSLAAGSGDTNNSSFEIVNGALKVKEVFNFETKSSYSVRIKTTDAGNLSFENAFTITINNVNETPAALALSANSINENSAIGTTLANLSSTDVDANDTHTYSLVAGSGDTNNSSFEIVGNQLKIKELFDFESKSSYVVRIRSTDAGSLSFENTFTISITDVNETPSAMAITKSNLYESNTINQVVGLLSTTDQDAGDSHTYSLVSGLGSTDNTAFNVSGNQIRASQVFSSATKNSYSIRVRTTDKGGLSFEKVYTVSISQLPTLTGTGNEVGTKLQAVASTNPIISKGFTSKLNVSGIDTASYNWSPSASLSSTSIYNPVAKPSQTQSYSVTVTNNYGSSTTLSITVEVMEDWNLLANNILTPNGDGVNDKWEIENLSSYPNNQLIIMDRSSRVLYRKTVYANEWNGLFNGIPLPSDTYYYVLTFDSPSGQKVSKKGFITITQ